MYQKVLTHIPWFYLHLLWKLIIFQDSSKLTPQLSRLAILKLVKIIPLNLDDNRRTQLLLPPAKSDFEPRIAEQFANERNC